MSVARELFKLQEIDQDIASHEHARTRIIEQLADNREIEAAETRLASLKKQLEEYSHQQHTLEWEIEDLSGKLSKFEEELYSGRSSNPKELSSLQHEIEILKGQKSDLEDRELELMEKVEETTGDISKLESRLSQLTRESDEKKQRLNGELKETETTLKELLGNRQAQASTFDSQTLNIYETLKKQRGAAVSKVERGLCSGCRISLPVSELQQVRSGNMVRCGSCGRILFLDQ